MVKHVAVFRVTSTRGEQQWVHSLTLARRLACGFYADAATKAPAVIERVTLRWPKHHLTRAIAVALLRGEHFASSVELVDPKPNWRKK
jgi:hypothetical protein